MVPILLLLLLAGLTGALWLAVRKWGAAAACWIAAFVSLIGASGVLAERIWGPQWSWNFAHHGLPYALTALVEGIFWVLIGLQLRAKQRASN